MDDVLIVPTDFAHYLAELEQKLKLLVPIVKQLHIDVMDGRFVPEVSPHLDALPSLSKYKRIFEAHLMVAEPQTYFSELKKKGFKKVIFHIESFKHPRAILEAIRSAKKLKLIPFLAINPETPVYKLFPLVSYTAGILFMGVRPGREHQEFIDEVYAKIAALKAHYPRILIQVDGGINLAVARNLVRLGVKILNVGSFISSSPEPKRALHELMQAVKQA